MFFFTLFVKWQVIDLCTLEQVTFTQVRGQVFLLFLECRNHSHVFWPRWAEYIDAGPQSELCVLEEEEQ